MPYLLVYTTFDYFYCCTDNTGPFQITSINREQVRAVLSQQQKFRTALSVAQELSSLASEVGMAEFEERLSVLKQLRDKWANGQKATVETVVMNDGGLMCMQCSVDLPVYYSNFLFCCPYICPTFAR